MFSEKEVTDKKLMNITELGDLGKYNNSYNQSHARWCVDNGYRIYREPYGNCSPVCTHFKIAVEKDGIKKLGTKIYDKERDK